MDKGLFAEGAGYRKMLTQRGQQQRQVDVGGLVDVEAAVRIEDCVGALAGGNRRAQHVGVARIAQALTHALGVDAVLAIADQWDRVIALNVKLLLQFAISRFCLGVEAVEIPGFGHPAARDRIDDAGRDCGGIGQLCAANKCHGLARLLQSPCKQAASEACADDDISG